MLEINHTNSPFTLAADAVTTDVGETVAEFDSDASAVVESDASAEVDSDVSAVIVGDEELAAVAEASPDAKTESVEVPLVPVVTMVAVPVAFPSEWYII